MLPDVFLVKEKELKEAIEQGELPFLGLFADQFQAKTRNFIKNTIQRNYDPLKSFFEGLRRFPALLSTYLVAHVMEGFGETGHFSVWPYVSDALGIQIPANKKQDLWEAFRKACLSLGLSVSPRLYGPHFMVEEYLRQAGYPLNFIEQLMAKMMKYAEEVGLPDEDDPNSIEVWRIGLIERLNPPFSKVARAAIEMDQGGYYVQLFIRLLRTADIATGYSDSAIERLMSAALKNAGSSGRIKKRIAIPQVVFRNYQVGILLPAAMDRSWFIESDEFSKPYLSLDEERFVALDDRLPFQVRISDFMSGVHWDYPIWEDDANNRFLIFSMPSGQLKVRAKISDKEIPLDPGEYSLVSRFKPDGSSEIELLAGHQDLYLQRFSLKPGECIEIKRGPACALLKADNVATIRWKGESVHGVRGEVIYPSNNLSLEIEIPEEILIASDSIFLLHLHSNSLGENLEINLDAKNENIFAIPLKPYLKEWKTGVTRLLAELRKKGSRRSLIRSSILIWNGLIQVIDRVSFQCDKLPYNIIEDNCENILFKENIITYRDDMNRFFKLVFVDGDRNISTTWAVPGIFLSLEKHTDNGFEEHPLEIGSTLSISPISRDVLKIFATQNATINIGPLQLYTNFEKLGGKRLSLASLREYIGPQNNQLFFINEATCERIPLLTLVSPHTVRSFNAEEGMGFHKINIQFYEKVEAFRFTTKDLLENKEYYLEFEPEKCVENTIYLTPHAKALYFLTDENHYSFYVAAENWPSGVWFIEIDVKMKDRWGMLTDGSDQMFAYALIGAYTGKPGILSEVCSLLDGYDLKELSSVFVRIHKILLRSYARESWDSINWLRSLWQRLLVKIREHFSEDVQIEILEILTTGEQKESSASRPHLYNLSGYYPELYCLPKYEYGRMQSKHNAFFSCTRIFSKQDDLIKVFQDQNFDIAALFGFSNAREVVSKLVFPSSFNMDKYKKALLERDLPERWKLLNSDDWRPGIGDYLGPMHYRYALHKFETAYEKSVSYFNLKIGRVLSFISVSSSKNILNYCESNRLQLSSDEIDLGIFDRVIQTGTLDDADAQRIENHKNIIRFLSLFAQICRCEVRNTGVLRKYFCDIKSSSDYPDDYISQILGYLLYVGEEIFCFYLLLWELIYTADYDMPRRIYVRN